MFLPKTCVLSSENGVFLMILHVNWKKASIFTKGLVQCCILHTCLLRGMNRECFRDCKHKCRRASGLMFLVHSKFHSPHTSFCPWGAWHLPSPIMHISKRASLLWKPACVENSLQPWFISNNEISTRFLLTLPKPWKMFPFQEVEVPWRLFGTQTSLLQVKSQHFPVS